MIPTKHRIFALIVLALGFVMLTTSELKGQKIIAKRKGNTLIEIGDSLTNMVLINKSGRKDTVFVSKNGKLFVWRISKKSGKRYRKYIEIEK